MKTSKGWAHLIGLGVLLLAASATTTAQTTYRWDDADGQTHYSDTPPPSGALNVKVLTNSTYRMSTNWIGQFDGFGGKRPIGRTFGGSRFAKAADRLRTYDDRSDDPGDYRVEVELCLEDPCGDFCPGDITNDRDVGFADILAVLSAWGSCDCCPADTDGNDAVDFGDVLFILGVWGPCL